MNEKVLGFYEKDVDIWHKDKCIHTLKNNTSVCVETMPVVSIKELEKWVKANFVGVGEFVNGQNLLNHFRKKTKRGEKEK